MPLSNSLRIRIIHTTQNSQSHSKNYNHNPNFISVKIIYTTQPSNSNSKKNTTKHYNPITYREIHTCNLFTALTLIRETPQA